MATQGRRRWSAVMGAACAMLPGCPDATPGLTGGGTSSTCPSRVEAAIWPRWRMPNPAGVDLPNPARYDTSTPGVVVDTVTCLTWQRDIDTNSVFTADEAQEHCTNLTLEGRAFRLPTRIELVSIVDFTKQSPAIDGSVFPDTPAGWFWTSSDVANAPSRWLVDFNDGATTYSVVGGSGWVRCVR